MWVGGTLWPSSNSRRQVSDRIDERVPPNRVTLPLRPFIFLSPYNFIYFSLALSVSSSPSQFFPCVSVPSLSFSRGRGVLRVVLSIASRLVSGRCTSGQVCKLWLLQNFTMAAIGVDTRKVWDAIVADSLAVDTRALKSHSWLLFGAIWSSGMLRYQEPPWAADRATMASHLGGATLAHTFWQCGGGRGGV